MILVIFLTVKTALIEHANIWKFEFLTSPESNYSSLSKIHVYILQEEKMRNQKGKNETEFTHLECLQNW